MRVTLRALYCATALAVGSMSLTAAERTTSPPSHPLYERVADDVYLQEVGEKIVTDKPVSTVCVYDGTVYLASDGVVYTLSG
ncbi:MAG: hypothetical protein KDA63_18800, partial [Planctomycetales bacterium]|nr:hypothetical protein [Planctomycetales bacterium]